MQRASVSKGVFVLNHVDNVVQSLSELRRFYLIIERRGGGVVHSQRADTKLVEDLSSLEPSQRPFPITWGEPALRLLTERVARYRSLLHRKPHRASESLAGLAHASDEEACNASRARLAPRAAELTDA